MAYCCSQCSFTAQFESALMMHHQLHHMTNNDDSERSHSSLREKLETFTRVPPSSSPFPKVKNRGLKLPARTSSATRLLGKLKARICRSKTLFAHPEELPESTLNVNRPSPSECTSKAMKELDSKTSAITTCLEEQRETYGCHLCSFEADRITVLDRHLLNHHKIGLENLLQLVMAKTKDGLSDDHPTFGIKLPYYKSQDEMIEEGEFIIETVAPKIKILKHAATNTEKIPSIEDDVTERNVFSKLNAFSLDKNDSLEKNCQLISKEIEDMLNGEKKQDNEEFLSKMKTLNDYMCKFVDSSNALKKVLTKELDSKINVKEYLIAAEPYFNLGLGDRDSPRNCERAQSERMERNRNKYGESCRGDKTKPSASACAESFYF